MFLKILHKIKKVSPKNVSLIHVFLLALLLGMGLFLRFYNYPYRFGLGDETVREAVIGIQGARELQAPLIGGFSSAGPFTWGPWFYYQMILASLLIPSHYAAWIYLSIASALCILLLYMIGKLFGGRTCGIFFAAIGTFSPALLISGTHLTFPNLTNIFALLAFWIFIKLIQKDLSYWWGFVLGIILGIAINIHYQMIGLLILPIVLLCYKPKRFLYFVTISIGICIPFIPLLLFDLVNHWHNFRHTTYYYLHGKNSIYVPNRWLFYLRDFWPAFWGDVIGTPLLLTIVSMIVSTFVFIWMFIKKQLSITIIVVVIAFLFNFILLRYYWGERYFGYLNYLRPFVIFFTAYSLFYLYQLATKTKKKIIIGFYIASCLGFFLSIVPSIAIMLPKDPFTMSMYQTFNDLDRAYPNKKFVLYTCPQAYKGNDAQLPQSMIFLLDKNKKLDSNGIKIGVSKDTCLQTKSGDTIIYTNIGNTGLIDLSQMSNKELQDVGWRQYSFSVLYNATTRWWFKEQP